MPPLGFVILTHSNLHQTTRLIRRLNAIYDNPPIALHHDFSQCPAEFNLTPNIRIVQPYIATRWGEFSVARAILEGIKTLYSGIDQPTWFALLSGACYPAKRSAEVIDDLDKGGYDAYLHHELIDPMAPRRKFQEICTWRYFNWRFPFAKIGRASSLRNIKTPKVLAAQSSPFHSQFLCYAGSLWFTARKSVADYILLWSKENTWLEDYLVRRPFPEEAFFHSIVCNAKCIRVSQQNYRHIDWSLGGPHPKTLELGDLPSILNSGAHFARKFAPDSAVLDALDRYLQVDLQSGVSVTTVGPGHPSSLPLESSGLLATDSFGEDAGDRKISVIIATFRRAQSLGRTLQSLEAQRDPNFEVIVVCDGYDSETRTLAESYQATFRLKWLFREENEYAGAARNAGANAATGEILLFLDDDATAGPDWIEAHRKRHDVRRNKWPLVVIGRTVHIYDSRPLSKSEQLLREQRDERDLKFASVLANPNEYSPEEVQLYSVCGFNCSIDRRVFLKSGGFDSRMRPRLEDLELGHRLQSAGVETAVDSSAVLFHHDAKNLVDATQSYWREGMRLQLYRLKHKAQRNQQLLTLRNLKTANPARRLHQTLSWFAPGIMRACASVPHAICDCTGSRWFLRQWERLQAPVDGMHSLRSEGVTLEEVRRLVGNPLLVIAVHNLSARLSKEDRNYHISPKRFRAILKTLGLLRYQNVTIDQGQNPENGRGFVLTIDDGFEDLYAELLPLIDHYNLRPLVFIVVDRLGGFNDWESPMGYTKRRLLSTEQMREMHRYGVEFGSHSCTHSWLPSLNEADLWREVHDSKRKLEDLLGCEVTSFAYPYGGANAHVRATVARAGYKWAFSVSPGLSFWDDPMWIKRVEVAEKDSNLDLVLKISKGKSASQILFEQLTRLRKRTKL